MSHNEEPHILVPIDGSPTSEKAIEVAADLAKKIGGKLYFIEVLHYRPESQFLGTDICRQQAVKRHEADLRRMIEKHLGEEGRFRTEVVLHHSRSRAIVVEAHRIGASFIVMGTHARRGLHRAFAGSVAHDVMRRAPCPVLMVGPATGEKLAA